MKKFTVVSFTILMTLILLLHPTEVRAGTHDIKGCLYVLDTRSGSTTEGSYVPLPYLQIHVWFIDIFGNEAEAFGTAETNSSGCFSCTLSGITVPEATTIKFGPTTQNSDWMVTDDNLPYSIYNYQITKSITVKKKETADFGDMAITESSGDAHGVLSVYRSMKDGIDLYESKTGDNWSGSGYQDIGIRFPSEPSASGASFTSSITGIHITADAGHSMGTLFHEWGHWLAHNDSSTVIGALYSYCEDYAGATYPYNVDPYTYTDPNKPDKCGHNGDSYENIEAANIEGYAEFFEDFLLSKTGDTDKTYDINSLDFWGQNNEKNIKETLLDLVDKNNESVTYRHIYQNNGSNHFNAIDSSSGLFPNALTVKRIGMDSTHAYGPIVTDEHSIYKFPLAYYGGAPTAVYTGLSYIPQYVVADSSKNLCVFGDDNNLYCGSTDGKSPLTLVSEPFSYGIDDIALVDGELFVLDIYGQIYRGTITSYTFTRTHTKLGTPMISRLANWSWSLIYTKSADEWLESIAVDSSRSELYLSGATTGSDSIPDGYWVKSCSLTSVCTPNIVLGSETQMGYRRGEASQTLLYSSSLAWANSYLYYADFYGVARYSKTTGTLDQYFNSQTRTFINDLNPLSGGDYLHSFALATNGTETLIQSYDSDTADYQLYYIDDSEPYTLEYYCGADNATLPAKDVVHMYKILGAYGGDFMTDLANINGMTSSIETGVSEINWLSLNKSSQECPPWEDDVIIEGDPSATVVIPGEEDDPSATVVILDEEDGLTSGGCMVADDPDQQYQTGQETVGPAQNLTAESIEVDDANKTYPTPSLINGRAKSDSSSESDSETSNAEEPSDSIACMLGMYNNPVDDKIVYGNLILLGIIIFSSIIIKKSFYQRRKL